MTFKINKLVDKYEYGMRKLNKLKELNLLAKKWIWNCEEWYYLGQRMTKVVAQSTFKAKEGILLGEGEETKILAHGWIKSTLI